MTTTAYGQPTTGDPLLTVEEVARTLAVSTQTVRRMVARGELAGLRVGERQWRVRPDSFRDYLDGRKEREAL